MKNVLLVTMLVMCLPLAAQASIISWSNVSAIGGLGVAVAVNGSDFESNFNEGITSSLQIEYEVAQNVAVYGDYGHVNFDPVQGAQEGSIEVSSAAAGIRLFAPFNTFGTVRSFVDLGVASNTPAGQDTEFKFRPGVGLDFGVTPQAGIRVCGQWNRYAGDPERVDGLVVQTLLRVTPGK